MEAKDKIRSFTDLEAWKEGHALVLAVYAATKKFPRDETFGIRDQMRRSGVSITSNIAEGFSRQHVKEKLQFYAMARGSLTELQNQLIISKDVGYLHDGEYAQALQRLNATHKLLNGLIRYLRTEP